MARNISMCVGAGALSSVWSLGSNKTDNEAINNSKTLALTLCASARAVAGAGACPNAHLNALVGT